MWVLLGIILGFLYIAQPVDALRRPVEWMNSALVEYTGVGAEWVLGLFGDSGVVQFLTLVIAVGAPGLAGLALNLVAPLGRTLRIIFSLGIVLVSFGAFGTLEWHHAALFSALTTIIGGVLALVSGPIIEALAAFFSVTLSVSQVRMLITDETSPHLDELMDFMGQSAGFLTGDTLRYVAIGIALVPTILTCLWLLFRFTPVRPHR